MTCRAATVWTSSPESAISRNKSPIRIVGRVPHRTIGHPCRSRDDPQVFRSMPADRGTGHDRVTDATRRGLLVGALVVVVVHWFNSVVASPLKGIPPGSV